MLLRIVQRLLRPSIAIRAFWIAVVALHGFLFLRRLVWGEWAAGDDQARLALALAGGIYGMVKSWRISTVFDRSPRRAAAFAVLLVFGHVAVKDSPGRLIPWAPEPEAAGAFVALPWTLALAGLAGIALVSARSRRDFNAAPAFIRLSPPAFIPVPVFPVPLYQRPPPRA